MSRSVGLLLAIAVALGLFVAFNPEARANAIEAWAQVKVAWADISERFGESMGALKSEFAQRFDALGSSSSGEEKAAREDDAGKLRLSVILQELWLTVSSRISVQ